MLLYAKTGEEFHPKNQFMMDGNKISVNVLDLSIPFSELSGQLVKIIEEYFGVEFKNSTY